MCDGKLKTVSEKNHNHGGSKATTKKRQTKFTPIFFLISVIIFLPTMVLLAICFIYKQIVNIYLKIKYGDLYGGMLVSSDVLWAIEDESKPIINIVQIFSSEEENAEELGEHIVKEFRKKMFQDTANIKLSSIHESCMGYNFFIKKQYNSDEGMTIDKLQDIEEDYIDQSKLCDLLDLYSNRPLPKGNRALWEIVFFMKPLKWNSEHSGYCHYAVLIRINHILGDGVSMVNYFAQILADDKLKVTTELKTLRKSVQDKKMKTSVSKSDEISRIVENIKSLGLIILSPAYLLYQRFGRTEINSALYGPTLTGDKNVVTALERHDENMLFKIKNIKDRMPGILFSHVVLTAISAGLSNYFKKKSAAQPEFLTVAEMFLMSFKNMGEKPKLENQFSIGLLDLPILSERNRIERLINVSEHVNTLRHNPYFQVNYITINYFCGLIPTSILKFLLLNENIACTVSNVPGVPKLIGLNGLTLEDAFFLTPHRGKAGLGFCIFTYGGKFRLSIIADKAIIESKDDAQSLLEDIFLQMHLLHEDICGLHKTE